MPEIEVKTSFQELSTRSRNALAKADIYTAEQLMQLSSDDLWNLPNMGEKSVKEVIAFRNYLDGNGTDSGTLILDNDSVLANVYGRKDISVSDLLCVLGNRACEDVSADELPFGVRVMNVLERENITTLAEICQKPYFDFLHITISFFG